MGIRFSPSQLINQNQKEKRWLSSGDAQWELTSMTAPGRRWSNETKQQGKQRERKTGNWGRRFGLLWLPVLLCGSACCLAWEVCSGRSLVVALAWHSQNRGGGEEQ